MSRRARTPRAITKGKKISGDPGRLPSVQLVEVLVTSLLTRWISEYQQHKSRNAAIFWSHQASLSLHAARNMLQTTSCDIYSNPTSRGRICREEILSELKYTMPSLQQKSFRWRSASSFCMAAYSAMACGFNQLDGSRTAGL